ncbi:hypothetical protein F8M41_010508 [Gigaspora margarita]|uniref:Uncharacterized protein n=1 Tax=Gigaspora margarita TaxID=4874 RepID=A0A8H3X1M0_GIGMA|nr:hypothetical protein F8M41_010508 [Gigaspora margarita]
MFDNKCSFCPRTLANLNSLSKYMTICIKNAEATGQIIANNSTHICNYSKSIKSVKQKQKDYVDINKYYSNSDINKYYLNNNISDEFAYKLIELDESNNISNSFNLDPTSNLLNEHETTLYKNQEFSNDFLNNSAYTNNIQAFSLDEEIVQKYDEFNQLYESKLEISDIAQHLEFEYKELYETTENGKEIIHKEQNNEM